MEAPSPRPKRPLRRLYREKLVSALALLICKSEGFDVSEDDIRWAHDRLWSFLKSPELSEHLEDDDDGDA